ncbi:MAG TPA: DoxX family protein [Chitinophagaceae bacterium]
MSKAKQIIYWVSTLWLSLGMVATGLLQLSKQQAAGSVSPPGVDGIHHLGYPVYFLTILGVSKILGVLVLLLPRLTVEKEWAYAGFFFLMCGAIYSHIAVGDPAKELFPSVLLLTLTIISWYSRPLSRKIKFAHA